MPILRYVTSGLLSMSHTHLVRNYFSEIFCPKKKKIWILQSPSSTLECCYVQFLTKRKKYIKDRQQLFVLAFTFDWTLNFRRKKEIDQRQTTVVVLRFLKMIGAVCAQRATRGTRSRVELGWFLVHKYTNTQINKQAQIRKYKHTSTHTQIQINKQKCANTNTQVHMHNYKHTSTNTQIQKPTHVYIHKYKWYNF